MKHNKVKIDVIEELTIRLKLIWRLIKDRRIPFGLKIIPFFVAFYLPMPDLIFGPLDDLLLLILGLLLFVQLCPANIVDEHMNELRNVIPGEWREKNADEDVLDGKAEEIPQKNEYPTGEPPGNQDSNK
jgi:hypothetical protein